MKTIEIQIPEELDLNASYFSMLIASKLYEDGKLSSGQAAKIAGLSKRAFIEILGNFQVSLFSKDIEDLKSDIDNA